MLSFLRYGELEKGSPLPQMVIDRSFEMPQAWCSGFVCSQRDELVLPRALGMCDGAVDTWRKLNCGGLDLLRSGGISACGE
jgi:hypothetical protein